MGMTSIYKDMAMVRELERRERLEANWCDELYCKKPPVEGSLLCKEHQEKAEKYFEEQLGIDPLWHMKHDVAVKHGNWAWTYFLGNRELGIVKIGVTTRLKNRMLSLRNSSPVPVKLFAVVFADQALELELHKHFAKARKHGEWFEITPELEHCIRDLQSQRMPDCIPQNLVPNREERIGILAAEVTAMTDEKREWCRALERSQDYS